MRTWLSSNRQLLLSMLSDLDTPIALSVSIQIKHEEWDALALRWVDPRNYPEGLFNALRYRRDVQAVDLLRKAPLPTSLDRRAAAIAAWEDAETQCYITNEYLQSISTDRILTEDRDVRMQRFLLACRKRMGRWLGPLPSELHGGFGPGTCVEYKGRNPTVVDKLWLTPTTTPDAAILFEWHYSASSWGRVRWADRIGAPGVSRGNRLTTVPKDGKTDRPIAIEPLGNLWLQLGIGRYLKRRLALVGLPDQSPASRELFPGYQYKGADAQRHHREMLFSMSGFSTIDLSNASDTVSLELVRWLLPPDWFELLNDCRSKLTEVPSSDGKRRWRHLEKFSSMGNGFTFELETFIFLCLLCTAFRLTPGVDVWVYGDDIILPRDRFDAACNLLSSVGFTPNSRKSFKDVPFFESCGGNVHSGIEVTPVRLKGPLERPDELYAFHNACASRGFSRKTLRLIRNLIPRQLQFPGPEQLGDVVLHRLPYKVVTRHSISVVSSLASTPPSIPLERWSTELAVTAMLLGSGTSLTRRGARPRFGRGTSSVS